MFGPVMLKNESAWSDVTDDEHVLHRYSSKVLFLFNTAGDKLYVNTRSGHSFSTAEWIPPEDDVAKQKGFFSQYALN